MGAAPGITRAEIGDRQDDLHHEWRRGGQSQLAQDHQDPRLVPNQWGGFELLYVAIQNAGMRLRQTVEWTQAISQFAILFGERISSSVRWGRTQTPTQSIR
jgi:hypothetical protein